VSKRIELQDILSLIVLSLIWGSSFILIKKSLITFNPVQVGTLRIVGVIGSAIPAILFSYAQTKIDSSLAGLLNTLTPIWVIIMGSLLFGLAVNRKKIIGVILGFTGALMLILFSSKGDYSNMIYGILIVISTLCYAASVNIIKAKLSHVNALSITVFSYLMAGLLVIAIFILYTSSDIVNEPEFYSSLAAVSALGIFGTALGSVIFFRLTQRTDPVFSSMVTYLIPIVALLWGFWDGENITLYHLLGMAVILSGVWLSSRN